MHVFQLRSGKIEPGFLPGPDGEKDGVELAGQIVQGKVETHPGVENHVHADALDQIQFPAEDGLGQPVLRNGEAQHAAGLAALFEDGDVVAQHGQIEGSRETCRTGAGHGHLAARRREFTLANAVQHGLEAVGLIDGVGQEAVDLAHIHHLVEGLATAAIVAGMLADAASRSGQGIVEDDGDECVFWPALLIKFEETRNVHPQGQLFSHGERASSWQTPARQWRATMWSSYSSRKWRMVVSTGLGAV